MSTRVLIVSSVCLYREGLSNILTQREGIEVAGTATDAREAVRAIESVAARPDIVLLDMASPESPNTARLLVGLGSSVLALTVPNNIDALLEFAELGISGFVTVDAPVDELVEALESVAHGEMLCSPSFAAALLRRVADLSRRQEALEPPVNLTAREQEIVRLIDEGLSNKQIAHRLSIQLATVKNHVHHIIEKVGAQGRVEAAARVRAYAPQAPRN
jgi:two-component system, NarL family, nitrate/nitrite response regulator NarL